MGQPERHGVFFQPLLLLAIELVEVDDAAFHVAGHAVSAEAVLGDLEVAHTDNPDGALERRRYSTARSNPSRLSPSFPIAVLQDEHNRPRTFPVSWS